MIIQVFKNHVIILCVPSSTYVCYALPLPYMNNGPSFFHYKERKKKNISEILSGCCEKMNAYIIRKKETITKCLMFTSVIY